MLATAAPAFATGTTVTLSGVGFATVTAHVTNYSTYDLACWSGDASTLFVAGEWIVSVTVSRSDGTSANTYSLLTGTPTAHECQPISKNGAAAGQVTIQAQFVGVGGQVYGSGEASAAWGPKLAIETP